MEVYIFVFLFSVLISSVSQIILKSSANKMYGHWLREYLNFKVVVAYGLFFAASLLTVVAYRYVPLSMGAILEASGYVFVTVLGCLVLKEKISARKLAGLIIIVLGIIMFNL